MPALWVILFIVPLCISFLLTVPVRLLRGVKGKCWGLASASTSFRHALGDASFVFTVPLVLAYLAELFPLQANCFTLGGDCRFQAGGLLFAWGFSFQVATIPLGMPLAAFAVAESIWRLRHRPSAQAPKAAGRKKN